MARQRVDAQLAALLRRREQLLGVLGSELVRWQVIGKICPLRDQIAFGIVRVLNHALEIRAEPADAHVNLATLGVVEQSDGVDLASVDLLEIDTDHLLQPALAGDRTFSACLAAEVEAAQPVATLLTATGDRVEIVFHSCREIEVDQPAEVHLEQPDDGKRHPGRNQRAATFVDVSAIEDGLDDRRVGRRTADAEFFERLDQAGFCVASGRVGAVPVRIELGGRDFLTLDQHRKPGFGVVGLTAGLFVDALDVSLEEAGEHDGATRSGERAVLAGACRAGDAKRQRRTAGVGHLRSDGPLPDQFVQLELVGIELGVQLTRGLEHVAGGADRLVGFLRVLDLAGVLTRRRMHVFRTVQLGGLRTSGSDRRLRESRRVGTHVGDVAVFVQTLCDAHCTLGRETKFASGFLLERRRHERRVRLARVRLVLGGGNREVDALQRFRETTRVRLVEHGDRAALELSVSSEIATGGDTRTVDGDQARTETTRAGLCTGVERRGNIPVRRRLERHPLAFTLDDDASGHRLDAAGRELRHDLLPENRADLVTVETVEDAAGFLSIDEVGVEFAGVFGGSTDCRLGDLVEDHSTNRNLGLESLEEMPGDCLALAVGVSCEEELVGVLQQRLEFGDLALLFRAHDIERLEVVIDVDAETGPRLALVLGRNVRCAAREVANVTDRCLYDVVLTEVGSDFARLGR